MAIGRLLVVIRMVRHAQEGIEQRPVERPASQQSPLQVVRKVLALQRRELVETGGLPRWRRGTLRAVQQFSKPREVVGAPDAAGILEVVVGIAFAPVAPAERGMRGVDARVHHRPAQSAAIDLEQPAGGVRLHRLARQPDRDLDAAIEVHRPQQSVPPLGQIGRPFDPGEERLPVSLGRCLDPVQKFLQAPKLGLGVGRAPPIGKRQDVFDQFRQRQVGQHHRFVEQQEGGAGAEIAAVSLPFGPLLEALPQAPAQLLRAAVLVRRQQQFLTALAGVLRISHPHVEQNRRVLGPARAALPRAGAVNDALNFFSIHGGGSAWADDRRQQAASRIRGARGRGAGRKDGSD